jgi:hypothetical protein
MKLSAWDEEHLPSLPHALRTAFAATVSMFIARFVHMPETWWAAIATLVVMQSTLGATIMLSIKKNCCHRCGRVSWRARSEPFQIESWHLRAGDSFYRVDVKGV